MRDGVITEADTCREFVTPRLVEAGWGAAPHSIGEQHSFTNGRIIVAGGKVRRGKQKRADYLLYYRRDYPLAVVEAKEIGLPAETGVQQAREYAEILGLKFAYATNGYRMNAKSAQAEGEALYWPIYNLDIKNPNAKTGLEHADPKDLIALMRSHEAEMMRLLAEIEALVTEVQA